jgi:hypothetical protein
MDDHQSTYLTKLKGKKKHPSPKLVMSTKTILNVRTIISEIGIMMNYKVIILSIIPSQNPIIYTSFIVNINFANPSKFLDITNSTMK